MTDLTNKYIKPFTGVHATLRAIADGARAIDEVAWLTHRSEDTYGATFLKVLVQYNLCGKFDGEYNWPWQVLSDGLNHRGVVALSLLDDGYVINLKTLKVDEKKTKAVVGKTAADYLNIKVGSEAYTALIVLRDNRGKRLRQAEVVPTRDTWPGTVDLVLRKLEGANLIKIHYHNIYGFEAEILPTGEDFINNLSEKG